MAPSVKGVARATIEPPNRVVRVVMRGCPLGDASRAGGGVELVEIDVGGEDLGRGAGHENVVVGAPLDREVAAAEMHGGAAVGLAGQRRRRRAPRTRRCRTPWSRPSRAPTPGSPARSASATATNSVLTRFGKNGWCSNAGPMRGEVERRDLGHEDHAVRVAHRDAGDAARSSPATSSGWSMTRPSLATGMRGPSRTGTPMSTVAASTRPPASSASVNVFTPSSVSMRIGLASRAAVVDVLGDAADAVAAHLAAAAVGVVHLHPAVGGGRRAHQDQAVGADPVMPARHRARQARRIGEVARRGSRRRRSRCRCRASWSCGRRSPSGDHTPPRLVPASRGRPRTSPLRSRLGSGSAAAGRRPPG